ncbi:unnamed protein product, partial [marine sediment metagenome]
MDNMGYDLIKISLSIMIIMQKNKREHLGKIIATSKEGIKVLDCKNCGYIHQIPIPNSTERENYYREKYFQETKVNYFEKQKEDLEYLEAGYSEKESILRKNISSKPLKILDIGAASGYFLKYFQEKDWKIAGIEPNKVYCDLMKEKLGLDLFCGTFGDFIKINDEKFSVVHLSFILEHVVDPYLMLKIISEQLLL